MTYNPAIHHRRSIRLKGYDYSRAGLYFITICTQNRLHLLGKIENGAMLLNAAGRMVAMVWNEIPRYYDGFVIREFVVMPNHIHGIIEIVTMVGGGPHVGAGPRACPGQLCNSASTPPQTGQPRIGQPFEGQPRGVAPTMGDIPMDPMGPTDIPVGSMTLNLPDIVHRFKTLTTKRYTDGVKQCGWVPFPGRLWQRNYYEHIIRNENAYQKIAEYIVNNPVNWTKDGYYDC